MDTLKDLIWNEEDGDIVTPKGVPEIEPAFDCGGNGKIDAINPLFCDDYVLIRGHCFT